MQTHDNSTPQNPQDHDSTQYSTLSSDSAHDTQAISSTQAQAVGTTEKTSGRWTDQEIFLLLDYVEKNSILTTARGLNLKKSEFNKACDVVKSKDPGQCHYKWNHVSISLLTRTPFTYL